MQTWPPERHQRAAAYLIDPAGRLLVFDHLDAPSAGTQVPAGGVEPDELPEEAASRELRKESG
jgi:ADP-ribose pyrophosphatase YjhB (NUDIX family)